MLLLTFSVNKLVLLLSPHLVHVALVRAGIGKASVPALPNSKKKGKKKQFNFG